MRLEGKVAIVTGAGRNIGEAVGHLFADEGAKVALIDVRLDAVEKVANAINENHSGAAIALQCDVSSSPEVQSMVLSTVAAFGKIDILVNNAAITDHTPALDLPEEEWDQILAVTLKSKNDPKSVVTGPINVIQFPHAGTDVVMNNTDRPYEKSLEKRIDKSNLNPKYL